MCCCGYCGAIVYARNSKRISSLDDVCVCGWCGDFSLWVPQIMAAWAKAAPDSLVMMLPLHSPVRQHARHPPPAAMSSPATIARLAATRSLHIRPAQWLTGTTREPAMGDLVVK